MTRLLFTDVGILRGEWPTLSKHYEITRLNLPLIMILYTYSALPVNLETKLYENNSH